MGMAQQAEAVQVLAEKELEPLRVRWLARDESGQVRRDVALAQLQATREGGEKPERDLRGISLMEADLQGVDFSRCDLTGADLTGANLAEAKMAWTVLTQATMYRCAIHGCQFLGASLTHTNLNECQGERVSLGACDLRGATLFGAHLPGVTFSKAKLNGADLRTATLSQARLCDADLTEASFAEADMRHADLSGSVVSKAVFNGADMREAHFRGISGFAEATWVAADIRDVDFCGAYLVRRHIMDENYLYEFRNRGGSYEIIYRLWQLTSDCGRSLLRWTLFIVGVVLLFAFLYLFVDMDYGDHETPLSPLYFSLVTVTTLGYGDVLPASVPAQILAMLEVTIGYVALGGMLSIFANKMARRAE